jgi:hypothetical protein
VTVSGYAPPNSVITIKQNGSIIGNTTTSSAGAFNKTLSATPGTHTYSLYFTDTHGLESSEVSFSGIVINNQADTPITNIHMPPTIALGTSSIFNGESTLVYGQGAPGSTLHLFLNSKEIFTTVIHGQWSYNLSSGYVIGNNSLFAYLTRAGLTNSIDSKKVELTVNNCRATDLACGGFVSLRVPGPIAYTSIAIFTIIFVLLLLLFALRSRRYRNKVEEVFAELGQRVDKSLSSFGAPQEAKDKTKEEIETSRKKLL